MDVASVLQGASENIIKGIAIEATAGDDVIEVVLVVPYTALESWWTVSHIWFVITILS